MLGPLFDLNASNFINKNKLYYFCSSFWTIFSVFYRKNGVHSHDLGNAVQITLEKV